MKLSSFALFLGLCATALSLFGEVRVLTLRQALDLALAQNPDLLLARLDQQKARYQVTVTHDPFAPKVFAGSGAAWSTGFPNSIEGSAPSIVTVRTQMAIFNRPQSYLVAQANEDARGAGVDVARRQEEVIFRVASLYLDAARRIANVLTVVLILVSALALIISGIGIMNIMLVTVTERTREIGLRMAVGAARRDVLEQFLAEAVIISMAGGVVGILIGVAIPLSVRFFADDFAVPISPLSIAVAFTVSLIVGLAFGLLPANRASRLNPTEALRYE